MDNQNKITIQQATVTGIICAVAWGFGLKYAAAGVVLSGIAIAFSLLDEALA